MNRNPVISVITVVYNAGEMLRRTLDSIKRQTYTNIETIVVDGGSTDGTVDILMNNQDVITRWVSEPDEGLYDAMNKGLSMATGDYVWFINAGDEIFDETILTGIFEKESRESDIYYGETMIIDERGKEIGMRRLKAPEKLSWKSLINGMVVCHQSFLVRKSKAPMYETEFRIAADYSWMLQALKNADSVINTHLILSRFLDGGLNKKNIRRALSERFRIMVKHYGFFRVFFMHFPIAVRFVYYVIKNKRF